ncbi:MAG: hypothetical protein V3S69_00015, partial [Dehalococcoidales bacterium]
DKALFAELLSPGAVSQSAEEKGIEKAEIKIAETMRLTGATRDEVIEIGRTQQIATLEEQRLKSLTARGGQLGITLNKRVELAIPQFNNIIIEDVLKQVQAGGVIDPVTMTASVNAMFDAKRAEIMADLPAGVDSKVVAPALQQLEAVRARTTKAVEDGSMINMITNNKDILLRGTQLGVMQSNPTFLLATAMNPSDMTRGLNFLEKAQDTAFGKKLAGELSLSAKTFFESEGAAQEFLGFYENMITQGQYGKATPPVTQQEKTAHAMAGIQAAKSKDVVVASQALESLMTVHGDDFAWAALDDHEIFLGVDAKQMGTAVENLQISQTEALALEFNTLAAHPNFVASSLVLTGNTLSYVEDLAFDTADTSTVGGFIKGTAVATFEALAPGFIEKPIRRSLTGLSSFLEKYNRAARISKKYADSGKINAALFSNPQKYLDDITAQGLAGKDAADAQKQQGQSTQKTLVWEDDAAGNPRLVEQ